MNIGLIVKVSKLCNLRCHYCYEMSELHNPDRMSQEQIEKMFLRVRNYLSRHGGCGDLEFIWHGGEPFAQPLNYWEEIIRRQSAIFDETPAAITNLVQSNLTLVREEHVSLLRRHFHVGFSYDVKNGLRVGAGGASSTASVHRGIEILKSGGVDLAGIAVISRNNVESISKIAEFFIQRRMSFRAQNLYEGRSLEAVRALALSFSEYYDAYLRMYELPSVKKAMAEGIMIDPLFTAARLLRLRRNGSSCGYSIEQCADLEWKLGINTNGDIFSPGDMYNPELRYGNIFEQEFSEFLNSPGRGKRVERSMERIQNVCTGCFLFRKGCNGTFVSHATPEDYESFQQAGGCYYSLLAKFMSDSETHQNERPLPQPYVSV